MLYYKDPKYNFIEFFNQENGTLMRTNIIKNGVETAEEPNMRSFPELIDIGIMGTCHAGLSGICAKAGIDCYQNATSRQRNNMPVEKYEAIISQCRNKSFQVALGGAGDPNKHENFEQILKITRDNNIVPNLTTSGYNISEHEIKLIKTYCGAVAVSFYSTLNKNGRETNLNTLSTIQKFVDSNCITNIHYVVSKQNIDEVIYRLEKNLFPSGINAIIFLLYKPVGLASKDKMLTANDPRYLKFLELVANNTTNFKIGFDSCQTPAVLNFCSTVATESLEFCEAARFSMYIDCDLIAYPCSFGHDCDTYSVDLSKFSIEDAWNSTNFEMFRLKHNTICSKCSKNNICRNCALNIDLNVCGKFLR